MCMARNSSRQNLERGAWDECVIIPAVSPLDAVIVDIESPTSDCESVNSHDMAGESRVKTVEDMMALEYECEFYVEAMKAAKTMENYLSLHKNLREAQIEIDSFRDRSNIGSSWKSIREWNTMQKMLFSSADDSGDCSELSELERLAGDSGEEDTNSEDFEKARLVIDTEKFVETVRKSQDKHQSENSYGEQTCYSSIESLLNN